MKKCLLESSPLKDRNLSKPAIEFKTKIRGGFPFLKQRNGGKSYENNAMDGLTRIDEIMRLSERKIQIASPNTSSAQRHSGADLPNKRTGFGDIIGQNSAIIDLIDIARKIARTDMIVSLRGATGTGKDLFAKAIHTASNLTGPFIPISCATLPEQLLESELFGYVGGAFTGCRKEGKPGLFEIAQNGTVLLDEITEMPLNSQAKILRLIQEKRVRRIGGAEEILINSRIITATNQNLEQMVEKKQFRQDLYYRINVLPIHIPPLQERREDIPLLANHYLFQLGKEMGRDVLSFTPAAMNKLCRHEWPGNVRELKNVIARAAILTDCETIDVDVILFSHEISRNNQRKERQDQGKKNESLSLKSLVAAYERRVILRTLKKHSSIRKAAKCLQLSHTALHNKIKKYQLS